LNESLHGPDSIDEREFHARLGLDRQRAVEFLARIRRLLDR
jgi:hypothetical protein